MGVEDKPTLKNIYAYQIVNTHKSHNTKIVKKVEQKINNEGLVITTADKENTAFIIKKEDYINKVETYLSENKLDTLEKFYFNSVRTKITYCS